MNSPLQFRRTLVLSVGFVTMSSMIFRSAAFSMKGLQRSGFSVNGNQRQLVLLRSMGTDRKSDRRSWNWDEENENHREDDWGERGAERTFRIKKGRPDERRQDGWGGEGSTRRGGSDDRPYNYGRNSRGAPRERQSRDGSDDRPYSYGRNSRGAPRERQSRDDDRYRRKPSWSNNNNRSSFSPSRGQGQIRGRQNSRADDDSQTAKIDLRALENAGFVHLYGLAPVLSALQANRRDFEPKEMTEFESEEKEAKPEAQFTPWLFVQDRTGSSSGRSGDKAASAAKVKQVATDHGIPIAYIDKGSLNVLSGNRPHQGFVLRSGPLGFEPMSRIPHPDTDPDAPNLWLVLDEVVDPQNLGAILRSAYFLCGTRRMGILVCAKNSAPPSPVVSAASAGALEFLSVYSTASLPRTLTVAREDGFRIIGAASDTPDASVPIYDLNELPTNNDNLNEKNPPTLLVLGSEGHGLRPLVSRQCTDFVRIPRSTDEDGEDSHSKTIDSLNVSVTGGILLWHLMHGSGSL